ncbi:oxidoreductase [Streptomyces sp. NPDC002784]
MTNFLEPAALGRLPLANRLVMAPHDPQPGRRRRHPDRPDGRVLRPARPRRPDHRRAATPNAVGRTYPNITAIHTPGHVAGWRRVTDAVREAGGPMFLQIQHGGRIGHPATSGHTPLAPSPVPLPDTIFTPDGHRPAVVPREMTAGDIRATVADFAAAARRAIEAGFEGVEVHAADGYLLHQFLAANTNHRTDAYGEDRTRFTVEVVEAVAAAIGPERVGVRLSPGRTVNGIEEGDAERLYPALVAALRPLGLAYLHLVYADPEAPVFRRIRASWPGPLIANPVPPELTTRAVDTSARWLLDAGADLVALGRPFLANPDLVTRLRLGAPLNEIRDRYLMYVGGATGYTDYPALDAQASSASMVAWEGARVV